MTCCEGTNATQSPFLALLPDPGSYEYQPGNRIIETQVSGGPAFRRMDLFNVPGRATVEWICDPGQYDYLMSFYESTIKFGLLTFYLNLLTGRHFLRTHRATIFAGSFRLLSIRGQSYIVGAELEIQPVTPDDEIAKVIDLLYTSFVSGGTDPCNIKPQCGELNETFLSYRNKFDSLLSTAFANWKP